MSKENKDIVKAALNAPSVIGAGASIPGMEDMDAQDVRIPRIKLLQGSCEEIKKPKEYPGLTVGMLVNSLTHTELAKQGELYPFIPVKMFKSWMKFNPFKKEDEGFNPDYEPGALIYKTYDAKDPFTRLHDAWRYKQINFLGFQPSNPMSPLFVSFSGMSRPVGNTMIDIISLAGRPIWEHLFLFGSSSAERNGNTFEVYTIKSEGKPSAELCQIGERMYLEFNPLLANMKTSNISLDEEQHPETPAASEKPF